MQTCFTKMTVKIDMVIIFFFFQIDIPHRIFKTIYLNNNNEKLFFG